MEQQYNKKIIGYLWNTRTGYNLKLQDKKEVLICLPVKQKTKPTSPDFIILG